MPSSLAVNNPFCILSVNRSNNISLGLPGFIRTFIRPSVTFFSNDSWRNACPNSQPFFSVFVLVLSSVSFLLLQVLVLHHWFVHSLNKISLTFFSRSTSRMFLVI